MKWLLILVILFGAVDAADASTSTNIENTRRRNRHPLQRQLLRQNRKKASPTPSPTPKSKSKRKKTSPTPTPDESPSATETPSASPAESPEAGRGKKGWPNVSLSPDAIEGYENDPPKVRQILDAGLALTKQNLGLHLWFCRSRERRHGLFRFHLLRS